MNGVTQQVVIGLAAGGIYALLALGIVLVRRATGVINFAQAALATLAAFVAAALVSHGWRFWPAVGVTIALAFVTGLVLERVLVRVFERASRLIGNDSTSGAGPRARRDPSEGTR